MVGYAEDSSSTIPTNSHHHQQPAAGNRLLVLKLIVRLGLGPTQGFVAQVADVKPSDSGCVEPIDYIRCRRSTGLFGGSTMVSLNCRLKQQTQHPEGPWWSKRCVLVGRLSANSTAVHTTIAAIVHCTMLFRLLSRVASDHAVAQR